jgi:hypothetical protein
VIGILLIVAIVLIVNRQRRSISLQQRFGPEYTRTIEHSDDRRAAEASLEDRARRRSRLDVVPLAEPVRQRYADQWRRLQEQFVDRPTEAVGAAEGLLTQVMSDRGYPVGEFDDQADLISVDHPNMVENYRIAHEIHGRTRTQQATTEDLREAMLRYRSLFDDLLHPGQTSPEPADRDPVDRNVDLTDRDLTDRDLTDRHPTDADGTAPGPRREHRR